MFLQKHTHTGHNTHLYLPTEAHTHTGHNTYIHLRTYLQKHTHTGHNTHFYVPTEAHTHTHTLDTIHTSTYTEIYTHQVQYTPLHKYSTYTPGFTYIQKYPHTGHNTLLYIPTDVHTPGTIHLSTYIQHLRTRLYIHTKAPTHTLDTIHSSTYLQKHPHTGHNTLLYAHTRVQNRTHVQEHTGDTRMQDDTCNPTQDKLSNYIYT